MMQTHFFYTYLKDERQACDVVVNAELTTIADPAEFGWDEKKLKKFNGNLDRLILKEFVSKPVKLFCGTKPLAIGAVVGGEMKGKKLNIHYEITEVYAI